MSNASPTRLIYNADGSEAGIRTGGIRRCKLDGCGGQRVAVRWPDRKLTYPCTNGMITNADGSMQIAG